MKRLLFVGGLLFPLLGLTAQIVNDINLDSLNIKQVVDTLIIDRDLNNWSLRLYGNVKSQRFKLADDDSNLTYTPNNPLGVGLGVATHKLIIDIGYNLKNRRKKETERFDLKAAVFLKKNILDLYVQVYEGFNVKNSINNTTVFRNDIKSIAFGIDYLYMIGNDNFSTRLLRTGIADQKENIFSFGTGGFLLYNQISADQSIIPIALYPYFNEEARIKYFTDYSVGVMGGLVSVFLFPSNIYLGISAKLGVGIAIKNIETESALNNTKTSALYKINSSILIGYRWHQFYINLNAGTAHLRTKIGFGNRGAFTTLRGKLALGYMLRGRKKKPRAFY